MATYKIPRSLTIDPLELVRPGAHLSLPGVSLRPRPSLLRQQSAASQCAYRAGPHDSVLLVAKFNVWN